MTNHTLQKRIFQTGAILAGLSVAFGAFGKHMLKDVISPDRLALFDTGVRYQFFHSLGLLFIAFGMRRLNDKAVLFVYRSFVAGLLVFCGGIYLLSTSQIWSSNPVDWIGAILPVGGLAFIAGWFMLALKGYRVREGGHEAHSHTHSEQRQ